LEQNKPYLILLSGNNSVVLIMKRFRDTCLMLLLGGTAVAHAHAHAFVDHADPPVGHNVKQMPREVRIWFTEPIEPARCRIKVFDVTGMQIDKKDMHADAKNKALLRVSLPPLALGIYKVVWQAVSMDTHATKGDFTFQFVR
jgi:methionine-rich copper-binding protein CopC